MPIKNMRPLRLLRASSLAAALSAVTFVLIAIRATRSADAYWDSLAYHWPFAARIAGICDRDCFLMPPGYENRYDGFPKLWHALQGLLWKVTGTPAVADLLSITMAILLCLYLLRRFQVPVTWSWLALIAIPEVQIQLTSSYVDLPLNLAITLSLMVLLRLTFEPDANNRIDVAIALLGLAIAANSKSQLVVVCLIIWTVIVIVVARKPSTIRWRRPAATAVALLAVGATALLPQYLLNLRTFGNPFYPIAVHIGPITLPGPEPMMQTASISDARLSWPSAARWLASVLEFDAFRGRPLPWTLDQGDVPQSSPSFRMGGYFVPYVLGALSLVLCRVRSLPRAAGVRIGLAVGAASIVCASLPLSHELRYYMFWMLSLVCSMLALVHSPLFASPDQFEHRSVSRALVAISAVSVILMTGADYVRTSAPTLRDLIAPTNHAVADIPDGATLCILNHHPGAFLYAEPFHPGRRYRTHVLWSDEPADCTKRLDIPLQ